MKPVFVAFVCIALVALLISSSRAEDEASPSEGKKGGPSEHAHGASADHKPLDAGKGHGGKGHGGKKGGKPEETTE